MVRVLSHRQPFSNLLVCKLGLEGGESDLEIGGGGVVPRDVFGLRFKEE